MDIQVCGVNHRTAPVAAREKLCVPPGQLARALRAMTANPRERSGEARKVEEIIRRHLAGVALRGGSPAESVAGCLARR